MQNDPKPTACFRRGALEASLRVLLDLQARRVDVNLMDEGLLEDSFGLDRWVMVEIDVVADVLRRARADLLIRSE